MDTALWIVGGVIALILCAWVVQVFTGRMISLRSAGRFYLSAQLKKAGVRGYIPDACVFEIADQVTTTYEGLAKHFGWSPMTTKSEILAPLERDARVIEVWLGGRDIAGDSIKYIPDSLRRHKVPLGIGR